MKKCPVCATDSPDEAAYCLRCGSELSSVSPTAAPAVSPPTAPVQPAIASVMGPAGWPVPPGQTASAAYVPAADAQTSGMAIGSLICGILFLFLPTAIAAVILGHISHSQIRKSAGRLKGSGLATVGLVLGYLGILFIPIILIIAAIAIPNLLRSKMAANEAAAVGSLRTLNTACLTYSTEYGGFPPSLDALGGKGNGAHPSATAAQLIDSFLQSGQKSGYLFFYSAGYPNDEGVISSFIVNADPVLAGSTGLRHFFTDQTGVIRVESDRPANANSPPLE